MTSRVLSMGLLGIDGYPVTVEVDITEGLPFFEIVGLPDAAVKESRERVFSALRNSGFHFEMQRTILNMAPADVRKEGPIYDLPIALGLLAALGRLRPKSLEGTMFLGELSLTGEVRGVRGALPMVLAAREAGIGRAALPADNAAEGTCVEGVDVLAVKTLKELVTLLNSSSGNLPFLKHEYWSADGDAQESDADDICRIKGQYGAKRALEVAAAGAHNMLMIGPPGSGKSMMARTIPTILPDLTFEEAIEVTKIYSVSGELERNSVLSKRPVRSPHHTATTVSLAGGGNPVHPGDISMAHCGVLFMDELPEFNRNALEVLRQPLEDGKITIARATGSYKFPARFMLVAAMNPCPCGYFGSKVRECRCSQQQIANYLGPHQRAAAGPHGHTGGGRRGGIRPAHGHCGWGAVLCRAGARERRAQAAGGAFPWAGHARERGHGPEADGGALQVGRRRPRDDGEDVQGLRPERPRVHPHTEGC